MLVALSLAPTNRHVLRSAARLFLHMNDPDRAFALLSTNTATRTDPWLMSAEIALAQVAHRNSRSLKLGTALLRSGEVHPRHLTELAGSVATEELINGQRKLARRAFRQSLRDPNGNAAAQGEWAALTLDEELVSQGTLDQTLENGEASAFHLYRLTRFKEAVSSCRHWSLEDPFSVRPFEFAATTAGIDDEYDTSIDFAKRGLELRPESTVLLNALAYAFGSLGKIDEAARALARIKVCDDPIQRHVRQANVGLLSFRRGDHEGARKAYLEAIEGLKKAGLAQFATRARVYYAREAMLARAPAWEDTLREAEKAMDKNPDRDMTQCIGRIKEQAATILKKIENITQDSMTLKPFISTSVKFIF
jgi:tetratricopeptide (TPR) repeat protein